MIELEDITSLFGLLESFTIALVVESFSFSSPFSRNSSVEVSVGVEDIVVELDVE